MSLFFCNQLSWFFIRPEAHTYFEDSMVVQVIQAKKVEDEVSEDFKKVCDSNVTSEVPEDDSDMIE